MKTILITELKKPKNYILLFFCFIYCLISLVNHYNFRTYAFDLGIYNNCLHQYGHLHKNHYPYLHNLFTNFLADHFSLYTVLLSPLHYIFGTSTLLYLQIISILFGAVGIHKIISHRFNTPFLPEIAMIHFLGFFGIYSALAFDYHDNVISAMLVPWFIYYFDIKNIKMTLLFAILIVIGKENMPIWLAFVCAGLACLHYNESSKRNLALILVGASIIYVVLIIKVVMPAMDPLMAKNGYHAFQYNILGNNSKEILYNLTHNPLEILKALFINPYKDMPELNGIKWELYACMLLAGGWMLLIKPQYIIMLIPIIAQKVFHNDFGKWGINYHYSIELAPIIIIGFYDGLTYFKNQKIWIVFSSIFCLLTLKNSFDKIEKRDSLYYNKTNSAFYSKEHYQCEFDKREIKRVMKLIPPKANLSALNIFCPHLSFRDNIYQFPDIHDAEYVLLAKTENAYPVRGIELDNKIQEFKNSANWQTLSASKGIYLFKRAI